MTGNYSTAAALLGGWRDDLLSGRRRVRYRAGDGPLGRIEIAPRQVTLFGGPPGAGKTAFVMQLVIDALRLNPSLRALVVNVEMPPEALLDRQLARLSGVGLPAIRERALTADHRDRVDTGLITLAGLADRLAFGGPPYSMPNLAQAADAFGAGLLVMDYIQRFAPEGERRGDRKGAVDAVMDAVRRFADCGVAVIAVAAVGRQRDAHGKSGYSGLDLSSFRESSELEYGADDAYILVREDPNDPAASKLKHCKSRHGEPLDIDLRFTGAVQRFDPVEPSAGPPGQAADGSDWLTGELAPAARGGGRRPGGRGGRT